MAYSVRSIYPFPDRANIPQRKGIFIKPMRRILNSFERRNQLRCQSKSLGIVSQLSEKQPPLLQPA
jgi:hypothetical protein